MTIDFGALLQGTPSIVQAQKESRAWIQLARLGDKPHSIELKREGTYLPIQTVRIEFDDTNASEESSDTGVGYAIRGVIFGIKDHATLPDTDIKIWDIFVMDESEYTITHVNLTLLGQIQAQFEAIGS